MRTERFKGALLSTLVIASLIAPVVSLLGNVGSVYSAPEGVVIYPDADITAGWFYTRYPQLKFDISTIPSGKYIFSAKLYLYRYVTDYWDGTGYVMRVDNQTWDEAITYDEFRNQTVTNVEIFVGKWLDDGWDWVDVTDQLNADYSDNQTYTSFRLSTGENLPPEGLIDDLLYLVLGFPMVEFYSREYAAPYAPYLEVIYGPLLPYQVEVEISPTYREGLPGGTLDYSVKVTNWGSIADNYFFTLVDNSGWALNISSSKLEIENAGKSEYATLSVTIPPGAPIGAVDNVVVIATSEDNAAASDNFWCLAIAGRRIRPTIDDAQVVEGEPERRFGATSFMYVGSSTTGGYKDERAFLKFDLQGIASLDNITSENARLFVYEFTINGTPSKNVQLWRVDNDAWVEENISWNDKPENVAVLGTTAVTEPAAWYSWDVTSYVVGEFASDNIASFAITAETEGNTYPDNFSYGFDTKEFSSWAHPRIAIGRNVWTTIDPEYREGLPGGTVKYTVNVWNMGSKDDSYTLENTDNSGWVLEISPSVLPVPAGEKRTAELSVTIPVNAVISVDNDNILVTATSENDGTVKDDSWVIAHAAKRVKPAMPDTSTKGGEGLGLPPTIWGIEDTIDVGRYAGGPERGWLRFDLQAIPYIDNIARARLNLQSSFVSGDGAVVRVHSVANDTWIEHENWTTTPPIGSVLDTRVVTEEDTRYSWDVTDFVREQFESDNIASFALVHLEENIDTVNSAVGFTSRDDFDAKDEWPYLEILDNTQLPTREVRTSISPIFQGGLPGDNLIYTVTVKNTGTENDSYDLSASDSKNWSLSISPSTLTIAGGVSDNATLSVIVPSGTVCTLDRITVTATGTGVSDDAMCFAHLSRAEMGLENLYKISVDFNFRLREDVDNLVAKFYGWNNAYQGESVVWENTPWHLTSKEYVPHPQGLAVENVWLVLVDEGVEIATVNTFTVRRSHLMGRLADIDMEWPYASPQLRSVLMSEIAAIDMQWPYASY